MVVVVVVVAAADVMEEVDIVEAAVAVVVEVSSICPPFAPVPSADGTNKDVGRRFHLF
jgi:hypothetical protein